MKNRLEDALGVRVRSVRAIAGGDICQAYLVQLEEKEHLFVKTRPGGPQDMFVAERRGLEWLAETEALRVPKVVAAQADFLALEYLESAPRTDDFDEKLGRGLAELHTFATDAPGLDYDNFIGPLAQPNQPCPTWPEFYAKRRLAPRIEEAIRSGRAPLNWGDRFERLFQKLPSLIPDEPNSRLHGDLWGGNLLVGPQGEPCLIDPAVYVGHREIDLAMMRLFGGFPQKVFDSYQEAYPLQEGAADRVDLYQLYPLLVHVNLFGGGYVSAVERALSRYV